ncbi:uncharacterized protein FIESC28_10749 [Fusarium coffeatum]|uniref:Cytochrome P450 n=1 Tax=Fusarium coffeatum TaxID=231269 RepID=A0A366QTI8_9HYPO|nr:uncharacterized protein FIESC28_10749 [Fusarium coffeatum]RBR07250.1 hypothetical protein FIESC28_10749 [Fusarium coffeatum]
MVSFDQTTAWNLFSSYNGSIFETAATSRALTAVVAGLAVHHLILRKGEWHLKAPIIIETWLCFFPVLYETLVKIDGPGSKTRKSDFYDFLWPAAGLVNFRDVPFHDARRRIWMQAVSAKNLPIYESQIADHAEKWEKLIATHAAKAIVVPFRDMAYWYAFDVMGMFMLSESFDMISSSGSHWAVDNLRRAMKILGPCQMTPWLAQIGFKYLKGYWLVRDWHATVNWCRERLQDRIKNDNGATNIASYLISDSICNDSVEKDENLLTGEAVVGIIAGSDTTGPTLTMVFYLLAKHPEHQSKLYEELQQIDVTDREALKKLPHLNAIIDETMRCYPAIMTGGNRDTPPEGMAIAGRFIPGDVTIVSPRYSIFRSERCYIDPHEFIPERWTSRPDLVKDSRSFRPFASGRYSCVGKSLALTQLRVVTALFVSKFHFAFAPGEDPDLTVKSMKDQFTTAPGPLKLVFESRN